MQAAALLYQITKQKSYLEDAQNIAEACHKALLHSVPLRQTKHSKVLKKRKYLVHSRYA